MGVAIQSPFKRGDLVAIRGFRVLTVYGFEAMVHYERQVELAAALRCADIDEAMRLSPHFAARYADLMELTA